MFPYSSVPRDTLFVLTVPLGSVLFTYFLACTKFSHIQRLIKWLISSSHVHLYMLMRDAEGRKKEASKVIQTTKQHNTP